MFDWLRKIVCGIRGHKYPHDSATRCVRCKEVTRTPWIKVPLKEVHTPIELSRETHEPIKLDKPKTTTRQNSPHTTNDLNLHTVVVRDFVKELKTSAIREANIQRRKDTLGYGVKGKFRPRPAHEKRLWKLDKKPEED